MARSADVTFVATFVDEPRVDGQCCGRTKASKRCRLTASSSLPAAEPLRDNGLFCRHHESQSLLDPTIHTRRMYKLHARGMENNSSQSQSRSNGMESQSSGHRGATVAHSGGNDGPVAEEARSADSPQCRPSAANSFGDVDEGAALDSDIDEGEPHPAVRVDGGARASSQDQTGLASAPDCRSRPVSDEAGRADSPQHFASAATSIGVGGGGASLPTEFDDSETLGATSVDDDTLASSQDQAAFAATPECRSNCRGEDCDFVFVFPDWRRGHIATCPRCMATQRLGCTGV